MGYLYKNNTIGSAADDVMKWVAENPGVNWKDHPYFQMESGPLNKYSVKAIESYAANAGIEPIEQIAKSSDYFHALPDKEKKDLLTKAVNGAARVAGFLPGPIGAGVNVVNQLTGGKLKGHEVSKKAGVNLVLGAAGGAAGAAMGVPGASDSILQGAQAGARTAIQRQLGLNPDARTLAAWFSPANRAARAAASEAKNAGSAVGGAISWDGAEDSSSMDEGMPPMQDTYHPTGNTLGGMDNKPQHTVGGTGDQSRYDNDTSLIDELPNDQSYDFEIPGAKYDPSVFGGGSGSNPGKLPSGTGAGAGVEAGLPKTQTSSTGGGGGYGGDNGMGALAIGLLSKFLDKGSAKVPMPATPTPTPQGAAYGAGLPTYANNLGFITNANAIDDQKRRMQAARAAGLVA